ncbi:MAG: hypothetical protein P1U81_19940 [Verrucomicrobiales bacterium]|nr:hypothetical protein [Verrucomicrobiales bacterium]
MNKHFSTLVASVGIAFASSVSAGDYTASAKLPVYVDPEPTGYIFAYGGFAFAHDTDSIFYGSGIGPVPPGSSVNNGYDSGYILGGGVGVYSNFMNGSRFELEMLHSSQGRDLFGISIPGEGQGAVPLPGELDTQAFFFNVVKEFPIGRVTGYAGGGFGFANRSWTLLVGDILGGQGTPFSGGLAGEDTTFAYQIKAGVDVPMGERLSLFTEYKLIGMTESEFSTIIVPINTDAHVTHNLVFGVKIDF